MQTNVSLLEDAPSMLRPWTILAAIAGTWIVVLIDQMWLWGIVMVVWAIRDTINADTVFIDTISRSHQPVIYWIVVGSWMSMGVLWLLG